MARVQLIILGLAAFTAASHTNTLLQSRMQNDSLPAPALAPRGKAKQEKQADAPTQGGKENGKASEEGKKVPETEDTGDDPPPAPVPRRNPKKDRQAAVPTERGKENENEKEGKKVPETEDTGDDSLPAPAPAPRGKGKKGKQATNSPQHANVTKFQEDVLKTVGVGGGVVRTFSESEVVLAAFLLSAVLCFAGWKMWRITVTFIGVVLGGGFFGSPSYMMSKDSSLPSSYIWAITIVTAATGGLLGAVAMNYVRRLAVFVIGACGGAFLGLYASQLEKITPLLPDQSLEIKIPPFSTPFQIPHTAIAIVVMAIVTGSSTLYQERRFVIHATAFLGAGGIILSASVYFGDYPEALELSPTFDCSWVYLAGLITLCLSGTVVQLKSTAPRDSDGNAPTSKIRPREEDAIVAEDALLSKMESLSGENKKLRRKTHSSFVAEMAQTEETDALLSKMEFLSGENKKLRRKTHCFAAEMEEVKGLLRAVSHRLTKDHPSDSSSSEEEEEEEDRGGDLLDDLAEIKQRVAKISSGKKKQRQGKKRGGRGQKLDKSFRLSQRAKGTSSSRNETTEDGEALLTWL